MIDLVFVANLFAVFGTGYYLGYVTRYGIAVWKSRDCSCRRKC